MRFFLYLNSVLSAFLLLNNVSGYLFGERSRFAGNLVQYRLFTRIDPLGIEFGIDHDIVVGSSFNNSNPTRLYIHGWLAGRWSTYLSEFRKELLIYEDVNYIEVDWSAGALNILYFGAKRSAQTAGSDIAYLLIWLNNNYGLDFKSVHIIGHSMGAQVAGAAGKNIQNPKIARISGLDPAQPGFDLTNTDDTLDPEDADFVDIIHTTVTASEPMGHADFFPNGGQLGVPYLTWFHSHMQAAYIFTASINNKCAFAAYTCESYQSLKEKECSTICNATDSCNRMGFHATPEGARGSLWLTISEYYPYCFV